MTIRVSRKSHREIAHGRSPNDIAFFATVALILKNYSIVRTNGVTVQAMDLHAAIMRCCFCGRTRNRPQLVPLIV